jgi:hypothetical protein
MIIFLVFIPKKLRHLIIFLKKFYGILFGSTNSGENLRIRKEISEDTWFESDKN